MPFPPTVALAPSEISGVEVPANAVHLLLGNERPHIGVGIEAGSTRIFEAICEIPSTTLSNCLSSTYNREPAQQHCPWLKKIA